MFDETVFVSARVHEIYTFLNSLSPNLHICKQSEFMKELKCSTRNRTFACTGTSI